MSGNSKYIAPVWENLVAPCGGVTGCPACTDIAGALHALSLGDAHEAWKIMMETHPLRSTLGRICYAFCEEPCNRGSFDTPISIQMLEAVIGDEGFRADWRPQMAERNGKKVLIIGSGPCGLVAGWYLNIAGFEAHIYEAYEKPGGMLRYGIPSYRLDRETLDREIGLIEACGVNIHLNRKAAPEEVTSALDNGEFHAAIIASGAGSTRLAGFPGEDKTVNGLEFLREQSGDGLRTGAFEGKNVVVVGGGNVAMDACRSAMRMGAASVKTIYRRTEQEMPAHDHEVSQAREEGVIFEFLGSPVSYDGTIVKIEKMKLGEPDESGRRRPVQTGAVEEIPADSLIMAIGQDSYHWDLGKRDDVFFGGDVLADSEGTVIHAIASGKTAADTVSRHLTGVRLFAPLGEEVPYDKMNVDRYFMPGMRLRAWVDPPAVRKKSFEPYEKIVSLDEAIVEADRCFRCGLCVGGLDSQCDWCFRACDEGEGIVKLMVEWNPEGPFYERGDDCNSCGRCWEDCPRYVVRPTLVEDSQ